MASGPALERGPWHVLDLQGDILGQGGQGVTYRAVKGDDNTIKRASKALRDLTAMAHDPRNDPSHMRTFIDALGNMMGFGALKVLHSLGDDDEGKKAKGRMKIEIATMANHPHRNLLRLLDHDKETFAWYVTELQPGGTLSNKKGSYTGHAYAALRDLRGVVAGVATLHGAGAVHRDIKPGNIFVATDGTLILGDFGLVFFTANQNPRLSATLENVGSRDWMPGWALSMRVDAVRPSFDVFGLGKVLYSMVSKAEHLRLWYHYLPEFDLEKMFPNDPGMIWINRILKKAVVEHEEQCGYKSAADLLDDFDLALSQLREASMFLGIHKKNPCKVCGVGFYDSSGGPVTLTWLDGDVTAEEATAFKCDNCGNIQLFAYKPNKSAGPAQDATAAVAKPSPVRLEVLGSRWVRQDQQGNRLLEFKVVLENTSATPDTVRRILAQLGEDGEEFSMRSEAGQIRLGAFDIQEHVIQAAPLSYTNRAYDVRLRLETVQGHQIKVTAKASPSGLIGGNVWQ